MRELFRQQRRVFAWMILPIFIVGDAGCDREEPKSLETGALGLVHHRRPLSGEIDEEIARLEALGYAGNSERSAALAAGVLRYDPSLTAPGLNLYVTGGSARIVLMDMKGEVLHEWHYPVEELWPELSSSTAQTEQGRFSAPFRRVHIYPNGDVLAIVEGQGLLKLDRSSNLLWVHDGNQHHDLDVAEDGSIYTVTRTAHVVPRWNTEKPVLEDSVTVLHDDGTPIYSFSLLSAFERSEFRELLPRGATGDFFHTNTIEILRQRHDSTPPAFAPGNLLISVRQMNTIAVVDPKERVVVWAQKGPWRAQHQPTQLANGSILLFDNWWKNQQSRIVEVDPGSGKILWQYEGTSEEPFYSITCGSVMRLGNGNTLVSETNAGRVFEITPSKEIVWEFVNPLRGGADLEFAGAVYELVRLPADFPVDWLQDLAASGRPGSGPETERSKSSTKPTPPQK